MSRIGTIYKDLYRSNLNTKASLFGGMMIQINLYKMGVVKKYIKALLFVFLITNVCSSQQEINDDIKSEPSSITLQLTAPEPKRSHDTRTDVNVTRTVAGNGNKLKFKYDVEVPSVDDFYFVLALDSSGSLGFADQDQAKAVIDAVPRFINYTIDEYPNKTFNMSIVGWDSNIDFIYPDETTLSPIRTVRTGLNSVFGEVDDPKYLYRCEESETTNISQPLRASIDILDKNPPVDYRRNMKFILMVVDAGEYARYDPAIITEARNKNYNIYIVGLGSFLTKEGNPTEMYKDLVFLCGEKSQISTCIPKDTDTDLSDELFKKLNEAMLTAISENVSDNVAIVEKFYGYIDPDETASYEVIGFPNTRRYIKCENKSTNVENNISTIIFQLPELSQDNVTEITFEANFTLKGLPISISEVSKPIIFGSYTGDQFPTFYYRWLKNDTFNFSIELQESIINIESAPTAGKTTKNFGSLSPSNEPNVESLGIGFGLMTLIILGITATVLRRKVKGF